MKHIFFFFFFLEFIIRSSLLRPLFFRKNENQFRPEYNRKYIDESLYIYLDETGVFYKCFNIKLTRSNNDSQPVLNIFDISTVVIYTSYFLITQYAF